MKTLLRVIVALSLIGSGISCRHANLVKVVEVSHVDTPSGQLSALHLRQGDTLTIRVSDSDPNCYTYNATAGMGVDDQRQPFLASRVEFRVIHDGQTTEYVIAVRRIATEQCQNDKRSDRTWTIPVS